MPRRGKAFGNVSEVVLESTDAKVEGGGRKDCFLAKFYEESFDLLGGAIFWEFTQFDHQMANAPDVIGACCKSIVSDRHVIVHVL